MRQDISPGSEERSQNSPTEKKQTPRLVSDREVKPQLQSLLHPLPPGTLTPLLPQPSLCLATPRWQAPRSR